MDILENHEIYNSIIKEFQLSNDVLKKTKEAVEALAKSRVNICKLLKLSKFHDESLLLNERELSLTININKSNIKDYEEKQIELKYKIETNKAEIKTIRLRINELEHKLSAEQQESRKLRETLRIFISREKFKIIKQILFKHYRKVFLKYSNETSIKAKILESNKRKEKIREEKQILDNSIKGCLRKITMDKKSIAQMRRSIINMQKCIDFSKIKLQGIRDYKEVEMKFRAEINKFSNVK